MTGGAPNVASAGTSPAGVPSPRALTGDGDPTAAGPGHSAAAISIARCFALGMFSDSAISAAAPVNTANP